MFGDGHVVSDADVAVVVGPGGRPLAQVGSTDVPLISSPTAKASRSRWPSTHEARGGSASTCSAPRRSPSVPRWTRSTPPSAGCSTTWVPARGTDWAARLWTAKEATAKATGAGLPLRPADLALVADPLVGNGHTATLTNPADGSRAWTSVEDGLVYALCVLPAPPTSSGDDDGR